jgi:hypothetical protein
MSIVTDLTPTQYSLIRIGLQQDDTGVVAIADIRIYNADGQQLATHNPSTTLTTNEKQVLAGFVNRELAAFEAATGLTKYVPPEEPIP